MKSKLLDILLIAVLLLLQASVVLAQSTDPRQAGSQIISRAKIWVDHDQGNGLKGIPYNNKSYPYGYRADCSGFASYAWQVKNSKGKPVDIDGNALVDNYGVQIAFDSLQPGDIINNMTIGEFGHVVIFVSWITQGTNFVAYEENANPNGDENFNDGRAIQSNLTLVKWPDGRYTIKQFEDLTDAKGPYFAYRYKNISGFANVMNGLSLSSYNPRANEDITSSFTIRNDGGQSIYIAQLTAGARGPGANSKGWNASVVDFPVVKNITLKPGQIYYYSQSRSFSQTGNYFAEPVKDQNGWGGIYPWPRQYFRVK